MEMCKSRARRSNTSYRLAIFALIEQLAPVQLDAVHLAGTLEKKNSAYERFQQALSYAQKENRKAQTRTIIMQKNNSQIQLVPLKERMKLGNKSNSRQQKGHNNKAYEIK